MEHKEYAESTQKQQPKKLLPRHRALMRKLISGKELPVAAEELGYSYGRAVIIAGSPLFKAEMERMQHQVKNEFVNAEAKREIEDPTRRTLHDTANEAARTLRGALSDESGSVRVRAATDILDRTGYVKEEKITADVLVEPGPGLINALERVLNKRKVDDAEVQPGTDRAGTDDAS